MENNKPRVRVFTRSKDKGILMTKGLVYNWIKSKYHSFSENNESLQMNYFYKYRP